MKKSEYIINVFMKIIATILITFLMTLLWLYGTGRLVIGENSEGSVQKDAIIAKRDLLKSIIQTKSISTFNENLADEYMMKGYVASLGDLYSTYYTKEEMDIMLDSAYGSYVGIGIYMYLDTSIDSIVIYDVIKNTPAEEAGLKKGDIIKSVNGELVNGNNYSKVSSKIKGSENTKVKLVIIRDDKETEMEITRKKVEIVAVDHQIINGDIGYIRIASFDGNIYNQFKEAYEAVKNDGAKYLIIDLRNNGGGVVTEATKIAEMFTDKDDVILIEKDKSGNEKTTIAQKDKEITMKTVILVNKETASSSEILAGCLKLESSNVTVMGVQTYGKGVIQNLYQFSDGSGLKLTTEEYYLSNNEKIDGIGVIPDIHVEYDNYRTGEVDLENDKQLIQAIEELKK